LTEQNNPIFGRRIIAESPMAVTCGGMVSTNQSISGALSLISPNDKT
jgi:hypothetical protein